MSAAFEFHGLQPGHSSHSHPTQSYFVEYSSHCKLKQGSGLESSSWQVSMFQAEGAPRCLHLDTESSEQKQTLGNQSGCSLKRDQTPPFGSARGFCIQNSASLAAFPHHVVPSWPMCHKYSLPALSTCKAHSSSHPCSGSSHWYSKGKFQGGHCSSLQEEQLIFILSFILLHWIRTQLSQISLYVGQHLKA